MKSYHKASAVGAKLLYSLATGIYKEKVIQADGVDAIKRAIKRSPFYKGLLFKDCTELLSQGTDKSLLPVSGTQKGHTETHTVVLVVKAERFKCGGCGDRTQGNEWCYQCTSCPSYTLELRCASVTPPATTTTTTTTPPPAAITTTPAPADTATTTTTTVSTPTAKGT
eukprot:TRINITY_DN5823_c0_g1_i1.p1 TRINITY_DN5823_c0_g1~~TRINITY_DN5823_c0_g1_i1.p1  ORF type:complete len:168 (+),score=45.31 TRINITY_DN5823_c0_g1_i1:2-505(+)